MKSALVGGRSVRAARVAPGAPHGLNSASLVLATTRGRPLHHRRAQRRQAEAITDCCALAAWPARPYRVGSTVRSLHSVRCRRVKLQRRSSRPACRSPVVVRTLLASGRSICGRCASVPGARPSVRDLASPSGCESCAPIRRRVAQVVAALHTTDSFVAPCRRAARRSRACGSANGAGHARSQRRHRFYVAARRRVRRRGHDVGSQGQGA